MNPELFNFHADWQGQREMLGQHLKSVREFSVAITEAAEKVKAREREIKGFEDAAILTETKADGRINGKNEETRRVQRDGMLNEIRAELPLSQMYNEVVLIRAEIENLNQARLGEMDELELNRSAMHHIDSLFYAIGGVQR